MKAKLDKEFLKKHLFWVLLTGAFGLWFISLLFVFMGPSSDAAVAAEEYKKKEAALKSNQQVRNDKFIPPWQERKKFYEEHKNKVWEKAWQTQTDIMTWPAKFPETLATAYFGDDIGPNEIQQYHRSEYESQFSRMDRFLNIKGNDKVYVPFEYDEAAKGKFAFKEVPHDSEELWLAQEELWARRDVFQVLANTLRSIGAFKEIREQNYQKEPLNGFMGGALGSAMWEAPAFRAKLYKERPPKDGMKSKLFRNHSWEVELLLEKGDGGLQVSAKSTIKNINPFERSMSLVNGHPVAKGLLLRITQKNAAPRELARIDGQMLPYGASSSFTSNTTAEGIDLNKDFELEEVFESATSPIKRLEQLVVGPEALSHRIASGYTLVHNSRQFKAPPTQPGGAPANPMGAPMGAPMGMNPMGGATPTSPFMTANGMNRQRYVICNEQVRKIPVGFVVTMDQAHRKDLLAAVANSRLQMHVHQVYWRHKEPPPPPKDANPMPVRPMDIGSKEPEKKGNESALNRNLIELTVHAVASFYERYPPKPPAVPVPPIPPGPKK